MFIAEPKTFHDSVKPLVYFNCCVGTGALRQPNHNATAFFFIKLYTVLINFFNWTTIYVTFHRMASDVSDDDTSSMSVKLYYVITYTNNCITVTAPLFTWFQRKGLRDCFRQMPILDDTFQAVLGVRNEYKKQYIRLSCQIIGILLVMFTVAIWDIVAFVKTEFWVTIESDLIICCFIQSMHHPILVMLLLDVNFCAFVGYLGKKFKDMNASLLRLPEKPLTSCPGKRLAMISQNGSRVAPVNVAEDIGAENLVNDKHRLLREIRKAHLELCKLTQVINLTFGIQNLLSSGISFVMITGSLYTIYSALVWKDLTNATLVEMSSSAIWTAIYASKIWIVNHSCWSVSNEAERTGAVIYELLNSKVDKELEREINDFAVQMFKNPIRFDVCGFFTLDYTFVQGVIGSITTYLIILIQLSPDSGPTTSNPLVNVTEI